MLLAGLGSASSPARGVTPDDRRVGEATDASAPLPPRLLITEPSAPPPLGAASAAAVARLGVAAPAGATGEPPSDDRPARRLDFGAVASGSRRERLLAVWNRGGEQLELLAAGIGSPAFAPFPSRLTVPPHAGATLAVRFSPLSAGPSRATLVLRTNDPDLPLLELSLEGSGVEPAALSVVPAAISAILFEGGTQDVGLTVLNSGGGQLDFSARVAGPGGPATPATPCQPVTAFVADSGAITVVDLTTGGVERRVTGIAAPIGLALDRRGSVAWVTDAATGQLAAVELATGTVTTVATGFVYPAGVALGADGGTLYVADAGDHRIVAVDLPTGSTRTVTSDLSFPWGIEPLPDGEALLVTDYGARSLLRVDLPSGGVRTIAAGFAGPVDVGLGPAGSLAYVLDTEDGSLSAVDLTSGGVATVATGLASPIALSLSPADPSRAWVVEYGLARLVTVDLGTGVTTPVASGFLAPFGLDLGHPDVCPRGFLSVGPAVGSVDPAGSVDLVARFDAVGLGAGVVEGGIEIRSNDPATPLLTVPATLTVVGSPRILVSRREVVVESSRAFSGVAARTEHSLAVPASPVRGGTVTVIAEGAFVAPTQTARVFAEGISLGSVSDGGSGCGAEGGEFVVEAVDLARLAADGRVDVSVINSAAVPDGCRINRHTVRLTYEGAITSVRFPPVLPGEEAVIALTVHNLGGEPLAVTSIESGAAAFRPLAASLDVPPGGQEELAIRFAADAPGPHDAMLTLRSNDPLRGTVTITLGAEVREVPHLSVSPGSFDEALFSGEVVDRSLTLANDGRADLVWQVTAHLGPGSALAETAPLDPPLADVLQSLNASAGSIAAAIPDRFDFAEGESGARIVDGGADMYDGGNYLATDGPPLPYTGAVWPSTSFGAGGAYFTAKYPGLFVLAADMHGVASFTISGNLGADGVGATDAAVVETLSGGRIFRGFVKRVHGAGVPSVNHLIIVEDAPAVVQEFEPGTDSDFHRVSGLAANSRLYYLLFAGTAGRYFDDANVLAVTRAFLRAIEPAPPWLTVRPAAGVTPPGGASVVEVAFDAVHLDAGERRASLVVVTNDPAATDRIIPVTLRVSVAPDLSVAPRALDFGALFVGGSRTLAVRVGNEGTATLTVSGIAVDHPACEADPAGFTLEPGGFRMVEVTFRPREAGTLSGTLTVASDDPTAPLQAVGLSGQASFPPRIRVDPPALEAAVGAGGRVTRTFAVHNDGGSTLDFALAVAPPVAGGRPASACPARRAFVASVYSDELRAVDLASGSVTTVASLQRPRGVVMSRSGATAFVAQWTGTIASVDLETGAVATVAAGLAGPRGLALDAAESALYVAEEDGDRISKVDLVTGSVSEVVRFVLGPRDVAMNSAGRTIYVAGHNLMAFDLERGTFRTLDYYSYSGVALGADGSTLYGVGTDGVKSFDVASGALLARHAIGGSGLALLPDERRAFVTSAVDYVGVLAEVDLETGDTRVVTSDLRNPVGVALGVPSDCLTAFLRLEPVTGSVPPGGVAESEATFAALDLPGGVHRATVVIASNDPATPVVTVPASLGVAGTPHLEIGGPERLVESTVAYTGHLAVTSHALRLDALPVGSATLELTAEGDYRTFYDSATAYVEGESTAFASGSGAICAPASHAAEVPPARLETVAADGVVAVEVRNTLWVGTTCPVNRHTVRLRYHGPVQPVDFGTLVFRASAERRIPVFNTGTAALEVGPIAADQPGFYPVATLLTVPPGGREDVIVTFLPARAGAFAASLRLPSNDPDRPVVTVELSGVALDPPVAEVSPAAVAVTLPQGGAQDQTILIRNSGRGPLEFSAGIEASAASFLTVGPRSGVVPPSESAALLASFRNVALADGTYGAQIRIETNDPLHPRLVVPATLTALGGSSIAITREETLESVRDFDSPGALTRHAFSLEASPFGEAAVEVLAEGDLDASDETATVTADGVLLGTIGATGVVCSPAAGAFPLSLPAAPSSVEVLVRNSEEVDPECAVNRHTVRLRRVALVNRLDFGTVSVGAAAEIDFAIRNRGAAPLQVISLRTDRPDMVVSALALTVPPGGSLPVSVWFLPSQDGAVSAHLTIVSNDVAAPAVVIPLTGTGDDRVALEVVPPAVDAPLPPGGVMEQTVMLHNPGEVAIDVTASAPWQPGSGPPPASCEPTTAYTFDEYYGYLWKIDLATGVATRVVSGFYGFWDLSFDPTSTFAYAVGEGLWRLDPTTGQREQIAYLEEPGGLALSRDGSVAWVTELDAGSLVRVDLATGETSTVATGFYYPFGVALDPAETTAYVTEFYGEGVWAVDLGSGARRRIGPAQYRLAGVAIDPLGRTAYLADYGEAAVTAVDLETGVVRPIAGIPGAFGIEIDVSGSVAWVTDWTGRLSRVDLATAEVTTIAVADLSGYDIRFAGVDLDFPPDCRAGFLTLDPASMTVPPSGTAGLRVRFDAAGLIGGRYEAGIELRGGEPARTLHTIPATLTVIGVPDIEMGGAAVVLESAADFTYSGATTRHHLEIRQPPEAGGALEVIAEGAFGYRSGSVSLEGSPLGPVGNFGLSCVPATAEFGLTAAALAAAAADGAIDVDVRNELFLEAGCDVNRHTLRLRYPAPGDGLDFGALPVGATDRLVVPIRNLGSDLLEISALEIDRPGFAVSPTSVRIPAGGAAEIVVTFAPAVAGTFTGTLTIRSDDPDEGTIVRPLRGEAVAAPALRATPGSFSESVASGGSLERTLTLANEGDAPLTWAIRTRARPRSKAPTPDALAEGAVEAPDSPAPEPPVPPPPGAAAAQLERQDVTPLPAGAAVPAPPSLEEVLDSLTADPDAVAAAIPDRFDFDEGEVGYHIRDGGNQMYSRGNLLQTSLATRVVYTAGTVAPEVAFGPAGRYFTAKFGGLFVLAADLDGIDEFGIDGELGATYSAPVDAAILELAVRGITYRGFVKRVHDGIHPSVNHLIISRAAAGHTFSTRASDDDHRVFGLTAERRLYYLLFAGKNGAYLDDAVMLAVMERFLGTLPVPWLVAEPAAGTVPPGEAAVVSIRFDAGALSGGLEEAEIEIASNDPLRRRVAIPASLAVRGVPRLVLGGAELAFEASADFSGVAAATALRLEVDVPHGGPGRMEVTAEGTFYWPGSVAVVGAEGLHLGNVGAAHRGGICTEASRAFPLSAAQVAELTADGVVRVDIENSNEVSGETCPVNRHVARLLLEAPIEPADFGRVTAGSARTLTLRLENAGTDVLEVTSIEADGGPFAPLSSSLSVAPGTAAPLGVVFAPVGEGTFAGVLTLLTNDPEQPIATLALRGQALLPAAIEAAPPALHADLPPGGAASATLTIRNDGGVDLAWGIDVRYTTGSEVLARSPQFSGDAAGGLYIDAPAGRVVEAAPAVDKAPPLAEVLAQLDANVATVRAGMPGLLWFSGGDHGYGISLFIPYDTSYNYLGTDRGAYLEYSNGAILKSPYLGEGSSYFTKAYPGLWVLAADLSGVSEFFIEGRFESYGERVDGAVLETSLHGLPYRGFVKRVYGNQHSYNHLIIVPSRPGMGHEFATDPADDHHRVFGLAGASHLYYLHFLGRHGTYYSDAMMLAMMDRFLSLLAVPWLGRSPAADVTAAGGATTVEVTFDASGVAPGDFAASLEVASNDPRHPLISIPVTMSVSLEADGDGIVGRLDNCPGVANLAQDDRDEDGTGDACDLCADRPDPGQEDADGDGRGDACDTCPAVADAEPADVDLDGASDACDTCPEVADPGQEDADGDGSGDACQPTAVLSAIDQDGGAVLRARALASDPQRDVLSGSLAIVPVPVVLALHDALSTRDCGAAYLPAGVAGQGIAWGIAGVPYLLDLDAALGCDDGVADYEFAAGSCTNAEGPFLTLMPLAGLASPAPICVRQRGAPVATELTVLGVDDGMLSLALGKVAEVWRLPFDAGLPRETALPGLESGATYRLEITVTDGSTRPVAASGTFVYGRERLLVINHPPRAMISAPATVECDGPPATAIALDGSGSQDPDSTPGTEDDLVAYEWFETTSGGGERPLGTGPMPVAGFPLGAHTIELRVVDRFGERGAVRASVGVLDTVAPSLALVATPTVLWPPDHRLVPVGVTWTVADRCDPAPSISLAFAASSEPDDGPGTGDGVTTGDVQGFQPGEADAGGLLRAERAAGGAGREYVLAYDARDGSGSATRAVARVRVPRDRGPGSGIDRLRVEPAGAGGAILVSWLPVAGSVGYDVVAGNLERVRVSGGGVRLGSVRVLARGTEATSVAETGDAPAPSAGRAVFYLAQARLAGGTSGFELVSDHWPRLPDACEGGCP